MILPRCVYSTITSTKNSTPKQIFIYEGNRLHVPAAVAARSKATATLQPEPTQHSTPTFVWAYIARPVWLHLNSTCLSIPTAAVLSQNQ
jgi:hypothetical protein